MIKKLKILLGVETKQAEKNIDNVGKKLNSVGVAGKVAKGGLSLMSKGIKSIGVALKAAGLALFVTILSQLSGLWSSNQKAAGLPSRNISKSFIYAMVYGGGTNRLAAVANIGKAEAANANAW